MRHLSYGVIGLGLLVLVVLSPMFPGYHLMEAGLIVTGLGLVMFVVDLSQARRATAPLNLNTTKTQQVDPATGTVVTQSSVNADPMGPVA